MELAESTLLFLIIAAFVAGFIDSIAGGGGLIAIPALLIAGLPPLSALGTGKLQALFGSGMAAIAYARGGHVNLRKLAPLAVVAFAGSVCGALLATILPTAFLAAIMPVALILIALYFAIKPDPGEVQQAARVPFAFFAGFMVPLIGFYDGVFGPGAGSFYMLAYVALAGYGLLKATAHTKLLNFASNVGGFLVFAAGGTVLWSVGLMMGAAQIAGATFGARLAMKSGSLIIKPLLVITCLTMAARLLFT
ncbi:MAG: TSUP family transporter [Pseudomonadota bacterium]